jgi:hypothetical protein
MSSESPRTPLPFEPRQKKKKLPKKAPVAAQKAPDQPQKAAEDAKLSAIPEAVSQRMLRRMALFCGIPTALALLSFVAFYWIVRQELFEVPTAAVAAVSMGLFGLGVVGLSYGIFSASWDEDRSGGWFGWQEFTVNFGRTINAWRSGRKEVRGK